jgi:hypothetical protein
MLEQPKFNRKHGIFIPKRKWHFLMNLYIICFYLKEYFTLRESLDQQSHKLSPLQRFLFIFTTIYIICYIHNVFLVVRVGRSFWILVNFFIFILLSLGLFTFNVPIVKDLKQTWSILIKTKFPILFSHNYKNCILD